MLTAADCCNPCVFFDTARDLLVVMITVKLKEFKVSLLNCTHGNSATKNLTSERKHFNFLVKRFFFDSLRHLKKRNEIIADKKWILVTSEWERQEKCKESIQLQVRNLSISSADSIMRKICRLGTKIKFFLYASAVFHFNNL